MASTRTQVYLTEEQRRRIDALIAGNGQSLAWVVREALDQYLAGPVPDRERALDSTFGAVPGMSVPPREEWNRYPVGAAPDVAGAGAAAGPAGSKPRRRR